MSDTNFNIAVTVDKTEVASGFDSVSTDAQAFVESINVQADKLGGSYARAFASISEDSKLMAANVSNDQIKIAEATRSVSVSQRESSAALRILKSGYGDADTNARLYAATLERVAQAQGALKSLQAVPVPVSSASAGPDANTLVSSAAQTDTSEIARREAAAELELAAAKLARKEVQAALAQSDADEATQQAALAAVNEDVAGKEAALTAVKAERIELSKAAAASADEEAAAETARAEASAIAQQLSSGAYTASSAAAKRLAAALLEKTAADVELKAKTNDASNALLTQAERIALIAPAAERARLATVELSTAQEELATSSRHTVTDVQATSGAIRSLEGNGGIRAVENFISKTLGLGPALQAIFPVVGALAFGQILFGIGEKVYDLEQKGVHAAENIANAFSEMHAKAEISNDDLRIQNDRLDLQIAKLSGSPGNGLQLALDESIKRADQLVESLNADNKAAQELFKQQSVSFAQSVLTGQSGTGEQEKNLERDGKARAKAIQEANEAYLQAVKDGGNTEEAQRAAGDKRSAAYAAVFQRDIDSYKREYSRLTQEEIKSKRENDILRDAEANQGRPVFRADTDNSAKKEELQGVLDQLQARKTAIELGELAQAKEITVGGLKQDNSGKDDSNKEAQQRLRDLETQLAERQRIRELEPGEIASYWAASLASFTRGSTEYKTVLDSVVRYEREASTQRFKDVLKTDPGTAISFARTKAQYDEATEALKKDQAEGAAALEKGNAAVAKWQQQTSANVMRTSKEWEAYFREVAKGSEIEAQATEAKTQAQLKADEAAGKITKLGMAQAEAAAHTRELAAELKALEAELLKAEAEAAKSTGPFGQTTDPKAAAEVERLKNQIAQLNGKGAAQAIGDQSQIQQDIVDPYKKAFQTISQDFNSTVVSLVKGQETVGQGFKKMAANEVIQAGQAAAQWLEKKAQAYLLDDVLHVQSAARQTATDATTAAATRALQSASSLAQVQSLAGVAGAAAFASTAATPIVGLELAPAAAATAVAGVESFSTLAAFSEGTPMVPRDGIAMLHKGEAVLDSPSAGAMREVLGGGGSRSPQQVHLHLGGNQFSSANGDFRQQFSQSEDHVISSIKKWQRDGKL